MVRSMGWLRAGLVFYLGVELLVGAWAAGWPRSFYDDFPWPGHLTQQPSLMGEARSAAPAGW